MYKKLIQYADEKYKAFNAKLIPNINPEKIIGVRIPILRKLAKDIYKNEGLLFLDKLPHFYHEENLIHAFMINEIKDASMVSKKILEFANFIDNWAVTDAIKPKAFKKECKVVRETVWALLKRKGEFELRLAVILMLYFLQGENFCKNDLDLILNIKTDFYYVNMARAWYVADLIVNNENAGVEFIKSQQLDKWTQNKSIQKAKESFRVENQIKTENEKYKL